MEGGRARGKAGRESNGGGVKEGRVMERDRDRGRVIVGGLRRV